MNDYHHFLRTRRSIRRFKPDPVPDAVMEKLLTTAIHAPSAHNLQPWRFVHVQTQDAKTKLGHALTEKMQVDMQAENADPDQIQKRVETSLRRIEEAPSIILICRDKMAIRKSDPEEHHMSIQSVSAAGLQLLLAAHAEGLAGNWICWPLYAQEVTQMALDIPKNWLPQALFFIGYSNEEPAEKAINSLSNIVKYV
jgi:coenzyme F420-0:L-glutamate ligase/coenzyme F420-1:gamma-L-glutamate ligase